MRYKFNERDALDLEANTKSVGRDLKSGGIMGNLAYIIFNYGRVERRTPC